MSKSLSKGSVFQTTSFFALLAGGVGVYLANQGIEPIYIGAGLIVSAALSGFLASQRYAGSIEAMLKIEKKVSLLADENNIEDTSGPDLLKVLSRAHEELKAYSVLNKVLPVAVFQTSISGDVIGCHGSFAGLSKALRDEGLYDLPNSADQASHYMKKRDLASIGLSADAGIFTKDTDRFRIISISSVFPDGRCVAVMVEPKSGDNISTPSASSVSEELQDILKHIEYGKTELEDVLTALADGDLSRRMQCEDGVFKSIAKRLNSLAEIFQSRLSNVHTSLSDIRSDTNSLSNIVQELSDKAQRQSAGLQETAATMEELSGTVRSSAENATRASQLAADARKSAESGGETVQSAISAMGRIEDSAEKITHIVGLIDDVAFQTNLLALNAAVEAARAGEAGKGFAVVASEVRTLAQRASQASREIKSLVSSSQDRVTEGVDLVKRTQSELQDILSSIGSLDQIMSDIASAARQQATGIGEITATVTHLDSMTAQTANLVDKTAQSLEISRDKLEAMSGTVSSIVTVGELPQKAQYYRNDEKHTKAGLSDLRRRVVNSDLSKSWIDHPEAEQRGKTVERKEAKQTAPNRLNLKLKSNTNAENIVIENNADNNEDARSIQRRLSHVFTAPDPLAEPARTTFTQASYKVDSLEKPSQNKNTSSQVRSVSRATAAKFLDHSDTWNEF
jgi:methyl-accepting chemotaxis protein